MGRAPRIVFDYTVHSRTAFSYDGRPRVREIAAGRDRGPRAACPPSFASIADNRGRERISLASPPAVADILPDAKPLASRALAAGRWRPFAVHASADHDAHDAMAPCAWHARHGAALPRTIQVVSGRDRGHSLPSPIGPLASIMWGWRTNRLTNRLFHGCGPASATMRRGRPRSFASVA